MKTINGVDIYENLKEIVDPSHTCLVVWDVQDGHDRSLANLARLTTLATSKEILACL